LSLSFFGAKKAEEEEQKRGSIVGFFGKERKPLKDKK